MSLKLIGNKENIKMINKFKNKKAQEEMIGFGIIIVMVMIILLVFISFSINKSDKELIENYEVESFIQAFLQYNTQCYYHGKYMDIKNLIFRCARGQFCEEGGEPCEILNSTLQEIVNASWQTERDFPTKGYELNIFSNDALLISFEKGNVTNNYKGGLQSFSKRGNNIEILFKSYY